MIISKPISNKDIIIISNKILKAYFLTLLIIHFTYDFLNSIVAI